VLIAVVPTTLLLMFAGAGVARDVLGLSTGGTESLRNVDFPRCGPAPTDVR